MFERLFGKSKSDKAGMADPEQSKARIDSTLDRIQKRIEYLDKMMELEMKRAKEKLAKGDKLGAKACLQRKKQYEAEQEKLHNQSGNLLHVQTKMEEATMDIEVFKAQQVAAASMKTMYRGVTVEQVDRTMDDLRDAMDDAQQIQTALSEPVLVDPSMSADVDSELEQLEQQQMDEKMLKAQVPAAKVAAAAASKTAAAPEEEELDRELAALGAPKRSTAAAGGRNAPAAEADDDEALRQLEAELS